ncbi:hypothetical protein ASF12_22390 [Paenibacillus sp. Leaf72]|nr:hypothetical protein ASF12_22390 [Paenibacillus sp. Leaf72]
MECERCGCNFVSKDDDDDVCIVCLKELELEEQFKLYLISCQESNTVPMSQDEWENEEELD